MFLKVKVKTGGHSAARTEYVRLIHSRHRFYLIFSAEINDFLSVCVPKADFN